MRTLAPVTVLPRDSRWPLPAGTFFSFLAINLQAIATEEVVGGIFDARLGRPSIPPEHLVAILLLRYFENVSYEVAAQRSQFDVRWKAVIGHAPTEPSPAVSDTTLNDFESALRRHGRHDVLIARTVEMARDAGFIAGELETAQDSSPVFGKGAVKDTYNLLGDAIRKLIRGIARAEGGTPMATAARFNAEELFRRSTKATADIDWSSPDARRGFLQRLVETTEALIAAINPREALALSVVDAIAIARKIIAQDIERDAQGQVRLRQGVAEDRLISVHEPEMRRGHKTQSEAFEGYKFHHTVELKHGFILSTEVTSANTHDSEPSEAMAERAEEASGCVVVKTIGDCAYGTEKNRVAHAEVGRTLVAKLPRAAKNARFGKDRFAIDLANRTVTCPQGVTTSSFEVVRARNAEPGRELLGAHERARLFVFPPEDCGICPQRGACVSEKHAGRSVEVGPNEALFIDARAYQTTNAYKADRRARQVVERQVARMVRVGARFARVFGMVKVRAQIAIIAAVVNLTRLATLQARATTAAH